MARCGFAKDKITAALDMDPSQALRQLPRAMTDKDSTFVDESNRAVGIATKQLVYRKEAPISEAVK
jgi:hypothetical protein